MANAVKALGKWIIYGLSTSDKDEEKQELVDEKTAVTEFVAVDTSKHYIELDGTWYEQP